jgi:intraflagellar transport protein 52
MYQPEKLDAREDLCTEVLLGSTLSGTASSSRSPAILVLGSPTEPFSIQEFDQLRAFLRSGGSLLVFATEGGESKTGTNINYLLEEFGIAVNSDSVVRTAHYKYMHPKEALISDGLLNRAILAVAGAGKSSSSKQQFADLDELSRSGLESSAGFSGKGLDIVYPYGCTLSVQRPAVPLLSTGKISYPMQQPLCEYGP